MYINIIKKYLNNRKKKFFYILFIVHFYFSICFFISNNQCNYFQDDLTLISAYYRIKSKHSPEEYLRWISNLVILNKSFVFFTNKEFMNTLKEIRPKELHYKTVFIEMEIKDFYSYKKFYKEFKNSFEIDFENSYHTFELYLVWAEKAMFLKKAILLNYFKSKCFYWIDAGYFRDNKTEMKKYINDWPSTKKCFEDKRFLIGQVKHFSESEKKKIINFNYEAHLKLQKDINVAANIFGGQKDNIIKFINYYYQALKLFIKHKMFIGKDQNVYTYVFFLHREIVKLVSCQNYKFFKIYLK